MSARGLPARPNLEQYKKQAKELLDAYQSGDDDAIRRVREHARGVGASGRQTKRISLTDAQFVLAREHGFDSWPNFAKHIETLTIAREVDSLADPVAAFFEWDLSNLEQGLGQASLTFGGFEGLDTVNDEPGFVTTMTVEDAVQRRRMVGVARINLNRRSVDFYTIGPAGGVNFVLAPDRTRAYGLESAIDRYHFWTVDLDQRRVISRAEFDGRPRMSLKSSSNGRVLYIYNAGHTIDLYEAATYRYLRTIELPGDVTTQFYVVPRGATPQ